MKESGGQLVGWTVNICEEYSDIEILLQVLIFYELTKEIREPLERGRSSWFMDYCYADETHFIIIATWCHPNKIEFT